MICVIATCGYLESLVLLYLYIHYTRTIKSEVNEFYRSKIQKTLF